MGYVHDTHMSQFIPPTAMMGVTGTFTQAAGAVAGTIALHRAAAASTGVVTIPIMLPSNSAVDVAGLPFKGGKLNSIEIDYELLLAAATSVTAALNKVKRGADTAVAVVSSVTITQDLAAAAGAETENQHKMIVTVTTPTYIENDEYYLLTLTLVCGGTVTVDILAAVANWTFRA